jgi:hypothetical protein
VDLGATYCVSTVAVYNVRGDFAWMARLAGGTVSLLDAGGALAAPAMALTGDAVQVLWANATAATAGRFVRVQLAAADYLKKF